MNNLNSKGEFFKGKTFAMPKVKLSKKRRRPAYRGVVNQEPAKEFKQLKFDAL